MNAGIAKGRPGRFSQRTGANWCSLLLATAILQLFSSGAQAGSARESFNVSVRVVEACSYLSTESDNNSHPGGTTNTPLVAECSKGLDYSVTTYELDSGQDVSGEDTRFVLVAF